MSATQTRAGTISVGTTDAAFGARYAYYVAQIKQKVASQWYTTMLDPSAQRPPRLHHLPGRPRRHAPPKSRSSSPAATAPSTRPPSAPSSTSTPSAPCPTATAAATSTSSTTSTRPPDPPTSTVSHFWLCHPSRTGGSAFHLCPTRSHVLQTKHGAGRSQIQQLRRNEGR